MKRLLLFLLAGGGLAYWWRRRSAARVNAGGAGWDPTTPPLAGGGRVAVSPGPAEIDEEFLSILACPIDKQPVRREGDELICTACDRHYPIRDGVPVLLPDA